MARKSGIIRAAIRPTVLLLLASLLALSLASQYEGTYWKAIQNAAAFFAGTLSIELAYTIWLSQKNQDAFLTNLKSELDHRGMHSKRGLKFHTDGRRSVVQHAEFIQNAKQQVVYLGFSLRHLSEYIEEDPAKTYSNHIIRLLSHYRKFEFICIHVDHKNKVIQEYWRDRKDEDLYDRTEKAVTTLESFAKTRITGKRRRKRFRIYGTTEIPNLRAVWVDPNDEERGRVLLAPYAHGQKRRRAPVYEIWRSEYPDLFEAYWGKVKKFIENDGKEVHSPDCN